jgi:trans-aconitate 2-methyltransferase
VSPWDATVYDRVSDPQVAWAQAVVDRLDIRPGETVLDAGCGSGRVTELLLERGARVLAVDADAHMVRRARERLGDRVAGLWQQDLLELALPEQVDGVFSNAVFHWIPDHPRLWRRLHDALAPGGRLVAQCGGAGNLARVRAIADALATQPPQTWHYAGRAETERGLHDAGFSEAEAWLEPMATTPPEPAAFLATVVLRMYPDPAGLAERVLAELGDPPVLDYVRLNVCARRPA